VLGGLTNFPRVNMPKWNGTLDYEHRFALANGAQLTPGARVHYETEANLRPIAASSPGDFRNGFSSWNVNVAYKSPSGKWTAVGYVDNLTNQAVAGTGTSGTISTPIWYRPAAPNNTAGVRYAAISPPRTYGLRLTFGL
jgi:iron complex outermembrane receptor protein